MTDSEPTNLVEYSVSELSNALKRTVEDTYGHVRVRGELGRISRPGSGHIYLDLKDEKSVIAGIIWKGVAAKMRIAPEQGLEVIVTGRLTTYPGQSKYQIIIESIEPAGVGALMALLEERRKKFLAEGLFEEAHKKPIPYLPDVIGVVTSPSGAVIRDILHRLGDRFPRHVLVWPVRVQGESSAGEVAAAINGFNGLDADSPVPRPDLLIIARGGGSVEDLWGFNEEIVVRAAFASDIPLISAIGHETDWTLLDHVADMRAPTPTAAAEAAVPVRSDLMANLDDLARRRRRGMVRQLEEHRAGLRAATRGLPRLADLLAVPRQRLDLAAARIGQSLKLFTSGHRNRLSVIAAHLSSRTLLRGIIIHQKRVGELSLLLSRAVEFRLEENRNAVEQQSSLMARTLKLFTTGHRTRLSVIAARLSSRTLLRGIALHQQRVGDLRGRTSRTMKVRLEKAANALKSQAGLLRTLSHQGVLARGFALIRDEAGGVIRSISGLTQGREIAIEMVDGSVPAIVSPGVAKAVKKPVAKPKARKPDGGNQGDLF